MFVVVIDACFHFQCCKVCGEFLSLAFTKIPPCVFCYLEGSCLVPSMGAVLRRHDFCLIDL